MKPRLALIGLSLLLAAVTLGSLLYVPASGRNRFRPLPPNAHVVYNNKNPDWFLSFFATSFGRCPASAEPLSLRSGPTLGKTNDEFSKVWKEKFPRHSLARASGWQYLEKSPLTVATAALNGRQRRDAWVAVSAPTGAGVLAMRWRLMLFPPEGVSPVRPYAAWPVWKLEHPSIPVWARVRFTLTDGLMICSISDDSHDIYKLLDILDGRNASLADRRKP